MPMSDVALAFARHDHAGCADSVMARAERLSADRCLRLTPVRRRVLEILSESHRALGAYDVLERLARDGFGNQPPVVYRALDFLVEQGLAHRIRRLNAFAACMHPDTTHSPCFFICRSCNAVAEASADAVHQTVDAAAAELGFGVERMNVEVLGLCPSCGGDAS